MTDDISKVVPPEAVQVKDDALNFGVVQAKDWVIPTACGVRVVDERMAYGWNECRKATIDRLESATTPAEVDAPGIDTANHAGVRVRGYTVEQYATLARQLAEAKAGMERRGDDMIVPMKLLDEINTTSAAWQERAEQAESQLAAATRRLGEVERSARVNESLERAAEELPSGWLVTVIVEKHAGWVELTDPHGNTDPIDDDEGSLATAVHTAIDIALTKEPTK